MRAAVDRLAETGPLDSRAFRAGVLDVVRRGIDFDWYVWVLTDPATEVGVDPLAAVPDLAELPRLVRLKYLTDRNRWTELDAARSLGEHRVDSRLWREAQSAHGVVDVVSLVFRDQYGCWGFLDLWSRQVFPQAAVELLARLTPGLTAALRHRQARTFAATASSSDAPAGAAVLLLDDDLHLVGRTPSSDALLARLLPQADGVGPVPAAAFNVAAQLLAQEGGVDAHRPAARVHVSAGFWITLKAARVPPSELIAVTFEASTPAERLDLFARVHGLTRRESELLTVLAEGVSTSELASRLFVSEHTVQDHLKSIFNKTDTHSRRSLLSHALGVRRRDAAD